MLTILFVGSEAAAVVPRLINQATFTHGTVTNADATEEPSHYEICNRSGFKVRAGGLVQEWTGLWVRPQDWEKRNDQDFVRTVHEVRKASISPEPTDDFLSTNEVDVSDL